MVPVSTLVVTRSLSEETHARTSAQRVPGAAVPSLRRPERADRRRPRRRGSGRRARRLALHGAHRARAPAPQRASAPPPGGRCLPLRLDAAVGSDHAGGRRAFRRAFARGLGAAVRGLALGARRGERRRAGRAQGDRGAARHAKGEAMNATGWLLTLVRASLEGGVALLLIWALTRAWPRMP